MPAVVSVDETAVEATAQPTGDLGFDIPRDTATRCSARAPTRHSSRLAVCIVRAIDGEVRCHGPGWPGYLVPRTNAPVASPYLEADPTWVDIDVTHGCAYYADVDELICWGDRDNRIGNDRTLLLDPVHGPVAAAPWL